MVVCAAMFGGPAIAAVFLGTPTGYAMALFLLIFTIVFLALGVSVGKGDLISGRISQLGVEGRNWYGQPVSVRWHEVGRVSVGVKEGTTRPRTVTLFRNPQPVFYEGPLASFALAASGEFDEIADIAIREAERAGVPVWAHGRPTESSQALAPPPPPTATEQQRARRDMWKYTAWSLGILPMSWLFYARNDGVAAVVYGAVVGAIFVTWYARHAKAEQARRSSAGS